MKLLMWRKKNKKSETSEKKDEEGQKLSFCLGKWGREKD